jgi:hypothetical protein
MRLDPVYLVAPESPKPLGSSRRTFLAFGVGGLLLGGGVGYFAGRGSVGAASEEPGVRTGGRHLDWARDLAQGPVEQLCEQVPGFLLELSDAPTDPVLWDGMRRLAGYVIETPALERRASRARQILDTLDALHPPEPAVFERLVPTLRRIGGR